MPVFSRYRELLNVRTAAAYGTCVISLFVSPLTVELLGSPPWDQGECGREQVILQVSKLSILRHAVS